VKISNMKAADIERDLKARSGTYVLKPNDIGKADVWKKFSLVFSTVSAQDTTIRHQMVAVLALKIC